MRRLVTWLARLALLAGALLLLAYGVRRESHPVTPLPGGVGEKTLSGAEFIEIAASDGLMRRDGDLHDIYSLVPVPLRDGKGCKT